MTSSNAAQVFNISDLLGERFRRDAKPTTILVDENLLVISCAVYRLRKEDKTSYHSLKDHYVISKITSEDRVLADKIAKYFQQKLLVLKLKNVPFTNYRNDLFDFVNNIDGSDVAQGYIYPENYLGLAYKLPYFYFYDLEIKELFGGEFVEIKGDTRIKGNLTLKFLKTTTPFRKYNNHVEYWFTDTNQNKVMLTIEKNNVLANLFDYHVKLSDVEVSGKFVERKKDNISYLTADDSKWNLVVKVAE
jgi:hypothetical protein